MGENLQYELAHLDKEINKCYEFRSRHEDIVLVSEDNFYKEAPEEISRREKTEFDEHSRLLARLDWEIESRKRFAAEADQLNKEQIQNVGPLMQQVLKSCNPLLNAYGMEEHTESSNFQTANLLPPPLYNLYMTAKNHRDAFSDDNMEVSIQGDKVEALRLTDESKISIEKESDSEIDEVMDADGDKESERSR